MSTLEFRADEPLLAMAPAAAARPYGTRRPAPAAPTEDPALWPATMLDRAIRSLASALDRPVQGTDGTHEAASLTATAIETAASARGWQSTPTDLRELRGRTAPAIVPTRDGTAFVVILGRRRQAFALLAPDGTRHRRSPAALDRLVAPEARDAAEAALRPLALPRRLARRLAEAERPPLACYRLRPAPPSRMAGELAEARVPRLALLLAGLLVIAQIAEIGGWGLFGGSLLGGGQGLGGMAGWMLLLASLHLLAMPIQRVQSEIVLRAGIVIKRRLQRGALGLDLDVLRRLGPSALTSRSLEAQALEQTGLAAMLGGLTGLVEVASVGMLTLGGAAALLHLAWLVGLLAAIAVATLPYARSLRDWSAERRDLAKQFVESIIGHRSTRLQVHPERRHAQVDAALAGYLRLGRLADRRARLLLVGLPSLWSIGSVAVLIPAAIAGTLTPTGLAISIGATLLGARAINTLVASLAAGLRARIAWLQLADILAAATRPVSLARSSSTTRAGDSHRLAGLGFRHEGRAAPVLDAVDLALAANEKLLLTGPSGSGKSTLGALLSGLRQPQSGRIVVAGAGRAMAAPQLHENHIFSATLAENLYPAHLGDLSPADATRARDLLDRLQLGELVDRMPMGLGQRLGSGGWALSQGEKSRICLARALLADADLLVLDESFGALDPDTARHCLIVARELSRCLVVIAHP